MMTVRTVILYVIAYVLYIGIEETLFYLYQINKTSLILTGVAVVLDSWFFLMVLFFNFKDTILSYRIDRKAKWFQTLLLTTLCLLDYFFLRMFFLSSKDRRNFHIVMSLALLGFVVLTLMIWIKEKSIMRQEALCPVSLDDMNTALMIKTLRGDVDAITIDSLSWLRAQKCSEDQIYVYLKETEGLVRYRVFQFGSEEEARLAVEKINNHVKNESFPFTKV